MDKAKSRLKSIIPSVAKEFPTPLTQKHKKTKIKLLFKYLRHLHTLLIGFIFYFLIYFILTKIDPNYIKNFLITNAYLPFLALVFLGNFFFFSFLFLNSKQGLFLSLLSVALIFLKIQRVVFELPLILGLSGIFLSWALITFISKRYFQHQN